RRSSLDTQAAISPELEREVALHPGIEAVDRFRSVSLEYDGRLTVLGSGDFRVLLAHGNLLFKEPRDARAAVASAIGRDSVVVSEAFALKGGVHAGDRITLRTPEGPRAFHVAGVYYDYT